MDGAGRPPILLGMHPEAGQVVVSVDVSSPAVATPPTTTAVGAPAADAPTSFPVTGLLGGTVLMLLALLFVFIGLVMTRVAAGDPSRKDLSCAN